jgi:hypothetical protein
MAVTAKNDLISKANTIILYKKGGAQHNSVCKKQQQYVFIRYSNRTCDGKCKDRKYIISLQITSWAA